MVDTGRGNEAVSGLPHIGGRGPNNRRKGGAEEDNERSAVRGQNGDIEAPKVVSTDSTGRRSNEGREDGGNSDHAHPDKDPVHINVAETRGFQRTEPARVTLKVNTATKMDGGHVETICGPSGSGGPNATGAAEGSILFSTRIEASDSNEGSPLIVDTRGRMEWPTSDKVTKNKTKRKDPDCEQGGSVDCSRSSKAEGRPFTEGSMGY